MFDALAVLYDFSSYYTAWRLYLVLPGYVNNVKDISTGAIGSRFGANCTFLTICKNGLYADKPQFCNENHRMSFSLDVV